jgi:hypothetical protein
VYDDHDEVGKAGEDAGEEILVVALSHAVIEPHAVVVEVVHTAVAGTAVFAR